MSMQYWPREIAIRLSRRFRFDHEILRVAQDELNIYMKDHLKQIPVQEFLNDVDVEEISEEENELDNVEILEDDE